MPSSPPPDADATPRRRRFGFGALALAILLVAIGAIVVLVTRTEKKPDLRVTQVSAADAAKVGERATGFLMPNLTGSGDRQFNPGGKPTVLTFWASWCAPCRKEFPLLKTAQADDPNLAVFGVVYKDIPADARAFVTEQGATWPNVIDQGGDVASAYGVRAIPQTFFIDRQGVIQARVFGITNQKDIDANLAKIR